MDRLFRGLNIQLIKKRSNLILIFPLFIFILSSCVPKATESNALCGTNQAFDKVSRTCYSITETRYVPSATLTSATISQEVPSSAITLTYTDKNNDKATSCMVANDSSIEAISPVLKDGSVFTKAQDLYDTLTSLKAALDVYYVRVNTAALANDIATISSNLTESTNRTGIYELLSDAPTTYYTSTLTSKLGSLETKAKEIVTLSASYVSGTTSISYYYSLAVTQLAAFETYKTWFDNKCFCTGGVCSTYLVSKKGISGSAGFSYTISDSDGASSTKSVPVTINSMSMTASHLRPIAQSSTITGLESSTSVPAKYAFTLPSGVDYNSTTSFTYAHNKTVASAYMATYSATKSYVASDSGLGKITNCLGLGGSTSTDIICDYVPNSGDLYSTTTLAQASKTIGDITITANIKGLAGNNIAIFYQDIGSDITGIDPYGVSLAKYGLVTSSSQAYLRVYGDAIYVFIKEGVTTTQNIATLINNDTEAKALVSASVGSTTKALLSSASSGVVLTGGVGAYDTFTYTVNNGSLTSTNTASVAFQITSVEDPPIINTVASRTTTALEDTVSISIDLSTTYTDAENNVNMCDAYDSLGYFSITSCTCASNICSLVVSPNANVSSTSAFSIYYRVCSVSTAYCTDYTSWSINLTPVNDIPILTYTAPSSIAENSTASPSSGAFLVQADRALASNVYESQALTFSVALDSYSIIPNTTCNSYKPGAGTPIGSSTPTSSGVYYYDTTNHKCYISTGTTNTSWKLYPSITAIPVCSYTSYGAHTPVGSETPSAAGVYYLDTLNNNCYLSTGTTTSSWTNKYSSAQNYYIAYTPTKNKSGTVTGTLTLKDDGGTTDGGVDTTTSNFSLTITPVNDPPYFISSITSVTTNEGGATVAGPFKVDEDEGASSDEDTQAITISSIVSSDESILPLSGISIFYDKNDNGVADSGEERTVGQMLEVASSVDSSLHNFYLKLIPVGGTSGNANVTVTVSDGTNTTSSSFGYIVNPVSAIHGGWTNIYARGLKTDKYGYPAAHADFVCNYNTTSDTHSCSGSDCTGTVTPVGAIVPDATNVIYWDSSNYKCYRSKGTTNYDWVEMKTACPISRTKSTDTIQVCSNENCISTSAPTTTAANQYYYNASTNVCYQSYLNSSNTLAWQSYQKSSVTFTWKDFVMSGTGADLAVSTSGYKVYRRMPGSDFDFTKPIATITDSSTLTYTDSSANGGNVYYYLVRPIDSNHGIATYTSEIFSEIRVIAPPPNYAFAHRWMINQEICNKMHMTTSTTNAVDASHNFRCPYIGPGGSTGYYDYGKDLLVDVAEAGCPYTTTTSSSTTPHCTNNGCIGIGTPTYMTSNSLFTNTVSNQDIYYDRSGGGCYLRTGGSWVDFNTAAADTTSYLTDVQASNSAYNSSLNPPMVKVTQTAASNVCTMRTAPTVKGSTTTMTGLSVSLPERKDYMAYSAPSSSLSETEISELELGDSINVISRCNGSSASGLASYFTDSNIPSSSYIYTLPGTYSSGIRSLYTGSVPWGYNYSTESCASRYGVQDIYGNVAEWNKDKMSCSSQYVCTAVSGTDLYYDFYSSNIYAFDLVTGPFNDTSGDNSAGTDDTWLTEWDYDSETFNAGKFSFPLGLPINNDLATILPSSSAINYILDIGSTNGITASGLHGDGAIINAANIFDTSTNTTQIGGFASGGSYLSSARSGRYTLELIPAATSRVDVGFRCIVPVQSSLYPTDTFHPYSNY